MTMYFHFMDNKEQFANWIDILFHDLNKHNLWYAQEQVWTDCSHSCSSRVCQCQRSNSCYLMSFDDIFITERTHYVEPLKLNHINDSKVVKFMIMSMFNTCFYLLNEMIECIVSPRSQMRTFYLAQGRPGSHIFSSFFLNEIIIL